MEGIHPVAIDHVDQRPIVLRDVLRDAADPAHVPVLVADWEERVPDPAHGAIGAHDAVFGNGGLSTQDPLQRAESAPRRKGMDLRPDVGPDLGEGRPTHVVRGRSVSNPSVAHATQGTSDTSRAASRALSLACAAMLAAAALSA
jgi:hypothetical protein